MISSEAGHNSGPPLGAITLADLRRANEQRQALWCPDPSQQPDLSFRAMELGGEVGEALNVAKKLVREKKGWRGSRATASDLGEDLADVVICADLMALSAGIDLADAVVAKFDATSAKVGLPVVLRPAKKEAAGDDALIRTLRASLAGAEQERAQAIAMAEAAAELSKADCAEIAAWRTRALRVEAERDAAIARAEKAQSERDAVLRLLADRSRQAVAGRDFTTAAGAALAACPQPHESGDPSWVVDEFRTAADETATRDEYLRVVTAKDTEIKQLCRAIRLLLGEGPSLPTTTMMHTIGDERVCLTPREYAEAFARAALAEQAPPS